ncbi:MAG: Gfo/Idh/MocA family protein [Planctomycetota bacterium]|jgi:predicted dehydrogenase
MPYKKEYVQTKQERITRRVFVAGAAAMSFAIVKPQLVRGTEANSKVKLGLIGCGGRGTWITGLFKEHGGYEIVAGADYFRDRVDNFGDKIGVDAKYRYTGLSGYLKLLDSDLDAVAIESPPYFHPEHAEAAVDSGRHVYLAKPIAVDVPGCNTVASSGMKASQKKLCFLVDFQTRANEFYIEALKRVHEGALGDFAFGESSYHAGIPWKRQIKYLQDDAKNPENRLRAWGLDKVLSGDIITEQNIHTLDVMNWIMNRAPLYALGTGGQKVRSFGTCWDHFAVLFQYPDNVGVTFSSRQFEGHDSPGGINNRMFGSKGVLETQYGGNVIIRGENFYRGGKTSGIYKDGAVTNIATFHKNIIEGNFDNTTVGPSVQSNLLTILGRTAAYRQQIVSWDESCHNHEKLQADLTGLKS